MVYRLRFVSIIIWGIVVSSLALIGLQAQENISGSPDEICAAATPAQDPETREYDAPEQALESDIDYYAIFCTEAGAIYVDLFEEIAPITVNNFVFLAQSGFYNNTTFHRVLENFMAQGGDPTGTGSGGPGYGFGDELASFVRFDRVGLLAMANSGQGTNTNGSQFFITTAITDWLTFNHTIL
jgi:peptidylprolyl isomerase